MTNIKKIIPLRLRIFLSNLLGTSEINERIDFLFELIELDLSDSSKQKLWKLSKRRWELSKPTIDLTWGVTLSGDDFISKLNSYSVFNTSTKILEVGPGYGRLLKSCLKMSVPFKTYTGLDLSKHNVEYLRNNFSCNNVEFIEGDVEKYAFKNSFDLVFSSLTFKHFYPDCQKAIVNLSKYIQPNGYLFFDLIEGKGIRMEADGVTFIRRYSKPEIKKILSNSSLSLVAYEKVTHAPGFSRLLIVSQKK